MGTHRTSRGGRVASGRPSPEAPPRPNPRAQRARILVVGEAPARDAHKRHLDVALACRAAGFPTRAGAIARLNEEHPALLAFCLAAVHVNLLPKWPGPAGRGSRFPVDAARMEAVRLQRAVRDRSSPERPDWDAAVRRGTSCVVLCGKRVATAWGIAASRRDFLRRFDSGCGHLVYLLPHPSGVNRWWNEERNRTAARLLLEGLGARHG